MINIREYENSEEIPQPAQYPRPPAIWEEAPGLKYGEAFKVAEADQEGADIYLWMLVGHSLRYDVCEIFNEKGVVIDRRPLKWREAFEREREALAWRAFAKDIGTDRAGRRCDIGDDWGLYSMVNGERVERTKHRDHVWKLFGARLPDRIVGKPADILETVHIKREKAAKGRGESYWRKGHAPKPEPEPIQGGLFQ